MLVDILSAASVTVATITVVPPVATITIARTIARTIVRTRMRLPATFTASTATATLGEGGRASQDDR
jgi:hypothetical protein